MLLKEVQFAGSLRPAIDLNKAWHRRPKLASNLLLRWTPPPLSTRHETRKWKYISVLLYPFYTIFTGATMPQAPRKSCEAKHGIWVRAF